MLLGALGAAGARSAHRHGGAMPGTTDESGALLAAAVEDAPVDAQALARAQQIARRLLLQPPRGRRGERRGIGELTSARYRGGSDEIDLDGTLEALTEHPVPDAADIVVRERMRTRRRVLLLVDISGSMRGERIRTAAATVGALARELSRDALAVIAFWSDAALLAHFDRPVAPQPLVETMLRMRARGLTNLSFALELAGRMLAAHHDTAARALLLSDCVHNAGPDPRPWAARLPRLDVVLEVTGEHDAELARNLARLGHGRLRSTRHYRDIAPAISDLFAN